uniref:Uncharacterized protein n=1 Tax=Sphaerodactylus townsendi TaxID=933632 RepID=A0ACB8GDM5_9SAUR
MDQRVSAAVHAMTGSEQQVGKPASLAYHLYPWDWAKQMSIQVGGTSRIFSIRDLGWHGGPLQDPVISTFAKGYTTPLNQPWKHKLQKHGSVLESLSENTVGGAVIW